MKHKLYQPLVGFFSPTPQKKEVISLAWFLELLVNEEDYYKGQQHNTNLMITQLRKIFYDSYGWNTELIRSASKLPCRYKVELVPAKVAKQIKTSGGLKRNKNFKPHPLERLVTVRKNDWMNPNAGTVPEIYADNNQQVKLPNSYYCDMGHVLAGIDAFNHLSIVTPLPNFMMIIARLFPHDNNNTGVATWLGDIASSAGEFLYKYKEQNKMLTTEQRQKIINEFAPAPDMLGDIDSYVIPRVYNTKTQTGLRVSEIFKDYYFPEGNGYYFMQRRFRYFAKFIGLKNWDGQKFTNEKQWLRYYRKQLRINDCFYIFSRCENVPGVWLAMRTWLLGFEKILLNNELLQIFLDALKQQIKTEPKN